MYIHEAIKKAQERNAAGQSWGLRRADWGEDYLSFGRLYQPGNGHDTCGFLILHGTCVGAWQPSTEELTADDWSTCSCPEEPYTLREQESEPVRKKHDTGIMSVLRRRMNIFALLFASITIFLVAVSSMVIKLMS